MTTLSEVQFNAQRMMLCIGDVGHVAPMPKVSADGVTSSDLRCEECGAEMLLVDVIIVDRHPTMGTLSYRREAPLYTTAKLHPIALLRAG